MQVLEITVSFPPRLTSYNTLVHCKGILTLMHRQDRDYFSHKDSSYYPFIATPCSLPPLHPPESLVCPHFYNFVFSMTLCEWSWMTRNMLELTFVTRPHSPRSLQVRLLCCCCSLISQRLKAPSQRRMTKMIPCKGNLGGFQVWAQQLGDREKVM